MNCTKMTDMGKLLYGVSEHVTDYYFTSKHNVIYETRLHNIGVWLLKRYGLSRYVCEITQPSYVVDNSRPERKRYKVSPTKVCFSLSYQSPCVGIGQDSVIKYL